MVFWMRDALLNLVGHDSGLGGGGGGELADLSTEPFMHSPLTLSPVLCIVFITFPLPASPDCHNGFLSEKGAYAFMIASISSSLRRNHSAFPVALPENLACIAFSNSHASSVTRKAT